jgi:hypothetical protein
MFIRSTSTKGLKSGRSETRITLSAEALFPGLDGLRMA